MTTIHWSYLAGAIAALAFPTDFLLPRETRLRDFESFVSLENSPGRRPWWWLLALWLDPLRAFGGTYLLIHAFAAPAGRHGLVHSPGYWIATAILALSCVCQCLTRRDPEALLAPIGYCVGCLAIIAAPAAAAIGCALAVTSLFAFRRLNAFFGVAIVTLPVLDYVLGGSLPWLLPGLIVLTLPLFLTLVTGRTLEIPTRGNPRGVDTGLPHR